MKEHHPSPDKSTRNDNDEELAVGTSPGVQPKTAGDETNFLMVSKFGDPSYDHFAENAHDQSSENTRKW